MQSRQVKQARECWKCYSVHYNYRKIIISSNMLSQIPFFMISNVNIYLLCICAHHPRPNCISILSFTCSKVSVCLGVLKLECKVLFVCAYGIFTSLCPLSNKVTHICEYMNTLLPNTPYGPPSLISLVFTFFLFSAFPPLSLLPLILPLSFPPHIFF